VAFAEGQGGNLALTVKQTVAWTPDVFDLIDELVWQFKVHAPAGYTLDAVTGTPIRSNYSWIAVVHDH
jgi:hypothetical protein